MKTREEVIRALKICIGDVDDNCDHCPYSPEYGKSCNGIEATRDALALLKEQTPRVMTLEELQAIETPWNRNTPPYLFVEARSATGSRWMSWGFMHDGVRLHGTMGVQNYGSKWRVWNLQPTPEQMRDTPWEGEEDHEA